MPPPPPSMSAGQPANIVSSESWRRRPDAARIMCPLTSSLALCYLGALARRSYRYSCAASKPASSCPTSGAEQSRRRWLNITGRLAGW